MAKTKPINPEKKSDKEKIEFLEKAMMNVNNILALYVEYNKDGKGFQRFLEERMTQAKKQAEAK
jgi:N-acetylglutamate synthase/N-acetylornithine aminotransferase